MIPYHLIIYNVIPTVRQAIIMLISIDAITQAFVTNEKLARTGQMKKELRQ